MRPCDTPRIQKMENLVKLAHAALTTFIAVLTTACSQNARGVRPPNPDEIPQSVSIEGGKYTSGLAVGVPRMDRGVDGFRISKYPITVAQFHACVSAGACTEPDLETAGCSAGAEIKRNHDGSSRLEGATYREAAGLPVTCVSRSKAQIYCEWIGQTLPTTDQWLLASRGKAPLRHAWGNKRAACENHPGARRAQGFGERCDTDLSDFEVGKHPKSASSQGLEDALLTSGELTSGQPDSHFGSCLDGACVASGSQEGAIDGFRKTARAAEKEDPSLPTYGFRCVLPGVQ
jgi:formylglycine-generating enzyme required for sulfatase activity